MKGRERKTKATDEKKERIITERRESLVSIELLIFAMLLLVGVLSIVMVLRLEHGKPLLTSGESYYDVRMAHSLKIDPLTLRDTAQGTSYEPNPYHYLLAFLLFILPEGLISIIFPLLLGIASALLFFKLLASIGVKLRHAIYSLIILAVTPAFIILFTGLYMNGFVVFLSLLIMFLMLHYRRNSYVLSLSILLFLILSLTSLIGFLVTVLALVIIYLGSKKSCKRLIIPVSPSLIAIALLMVFTGYAPRFLGFHSFTFRNIFSVLRASLGFDLFLLAIFAAGFLILWARTEQKRLIHLAVLCLVGLSFFNATARAFASFVITFYCVSAILYFYERKWELEIIRTGTLLLVLCSLVFSATNQVNLLINSPPDRETRNALVNLREFSDGKVLTLEENGFLTEFYSGKQVLLDGNSAMLPGYRELRNATEVIFGSARLKDAAPLLLQHNITYILITPDMKESLWEDRPEGLWFLVHNSESFIQKYDAGNIEIWEYSGQRNNGGSGDSAGGNSASGLAG